MTVLDFEGEIAYMEQLGRTKNPKYRLYSFVNMYLSGIQKGIQTAHMLQEMNLKWAHNAKLLNWAYTEKTIIVLEGGKSAMLEYLKKTFTQSEFPHASFSEDEESLNNALTCVGILLPHDGTDICGDVIPGQIACMVRQGKLACN
jgi:hypothetical protein